MSIFVLDCSVAMSWCFDDEKIEHSKNILELFKQMRSVVPSIWPLEVSNVLRVAERQERITTIDSDMFLDLVNSLPIDIDAGLNTLFCRQILKITRKHAISSYDAAYLELALRYDIPLASFDRNLCLVAKKEGIKIL